jgi:DNA-directed RNA polymerase specialized sigma24 family protein
MNEPSGASESGSDAELLNTIRSGEPGSADLLRERHAAAARSLAGHLEQEPAAADELVERAFAQVLDAIQRGGGPSDAFRPYLLTAIRRAARGGSASAPLPTDEQQIRDPGQPLLDPAPGAAASPVVTAFFSLPERWRAVLWHTEIEGATPAEAAPLLGLTSAEVADLADSARDGLRREYSQLQAACGREDADIADIGNVSSALRAAVAPVILGSAATAYLADLASSRAVGPGGALSGGAASSGTTSAESVAGGVVPASTASHDAVSGRGGSGRFTSSAAKGSSRAGGAGGAALASAGSWARTAGSSLSGRIRGSSARQRTFAVGTVALLAMFALGGYALAQNSATESATTSGQRTAAVPASSAPASPAQSPAAPASSGPAGGGAGSTGRTPAAGKSGSPAPAGPAAGAVPPPAPTVPGTPAPSQPTASPTAPSQPTPSHSAPSHAPSPPAPSPSPPGPPTPAPPMPSRPAPVGSGPAAPQVTAQISVADPVGLSDLAEITFAIADTGPVATGPLSASIALPPGSTLLAAWSGPGIIGWQCTAAGSSSAGTSTAGSSSAGTSTTDSTEQGSNEQGSTATCVHDPIGATAQADGILTVAVTGPAACGQPVTVTVTGGAAVTSAQSAGTIQCAPSPQSSAAAVRVTDPPTADPSPTPDATPSEGTGPWWHAPGGHWPDRHWPGNPWPRDPWPGNSWPSSPWPHPQGPAHHWPGQ